MIAAVDQPALQRALFFPAELGQAALQRLAVHAGGRGKAGGVKLCGSEHEIQDATNEMFGRKLVTHQTGAEGKGIYRVYVEAAVDFTREIYLGFVLDRTSQRVMIVASSEGGMEIEEISAKKPESIVRSTVDLAHNLGLSVVAEGVESFEQLNFLRGTSCDAAQGFLFSEPVHADKFEPLLQNRKQPGQFFH